MFSINKLFGKNVNRNNGVIMVFIALLTAITSEINVVPFDGEAFRFGLGSVTFFLLILIWDPVFLIWTGIVTGIVVVCFRIFEDIVLNGIVLATSLMNHLPSFIFYFLFALGLRSVKIERYKTSPLILGSWAFLFELIGNGTEQFTRYGMLHQANLNLRDWALISGVAVVRSFFVVGLYSSITVSEQKKRMQEMLKVGSELYAETLYLQKSMNHIEQITASSHDLYRKLKKTEFHQLSVQALNIAQEIHEVKKDSQRILAGLTKITVQKSEDAFSLSDVLNLIVISNEKYSELLKKNIIYHLHMSIDFETYQQIPLLALLNNLTANAVESIIDKGEINFEIFEESAQTCFVIKDSGKGIPQEDVSIIFEPGYTTKFNNQGVAATGIGLSHVKEIIHNLEGQIQVETLERGTVFRIHIPTKNIRK